MTSYVFVCDSDSVLTTDTCTGSSSWVENSASSTLSIEEIDVQAFAMVDGFLLVSFFVGHAAGRLVKWLGR